MSQTVYDDSMMTGSKEWSMGSLLAESWLFSHFLFSHR
jgi:hypothetical protein